MSIVLFALIGARLQMGIAYWICFAVFCTIKVAMAVYKAKNEIED